MNLIDIVSLNDKEFQDYINSLLLKGNKFYFSSLTERKYPLFFSYDKKSSYSFYQCVDNSFFCYSSMLLCRTTFLFAVSKRYIVNGIYQTATASRHIKMTPPIIPPKIKFRATIPTVPAMS